MKSTKINKKFKRARKKNKGNRNFERNCEQKNGPEEGPCGCLLFLRRRCITCIPIPSAAPPCSATRAFCLPLSPPLALRRLVAAAASVLSQVLRLQLVSSPATSTHQVLPPLQAVHRNPNLKLFSYLTSLLTSKFLQKLLGVHPCPFTGSAPAES